MAQPTPRRAPDGAPHRRARRLAGIASALAGVIALAALIAALRRYGATGEPALYRLVLPLLAAVGLVVWSARPAWLRQRRVLALGAVGALLLSGVAALPTVPARGFTVAVIGWAGLALAFHWSAKSTDAAAAVLAIVAAIGGAEAAYGLLVPTPPTPDRGAAVLGGLAAGTYFNPNHLAGLLAAALPLTAALALAAAGTWRRRRRTWLGLALAAACIAVAAVVGLAILRSQSTTGRVAAAAALGLLAVLLVARLRPGMARGLSLSIAAGLVVTLAATAAAGMARAPLGGLEASLSAQGRLPAWRDTLQLIGDHPLAGIGPGMYRWRFRPYQTEQLKNLYDHPHNDYLEVAAEWGVPAALLFWGFVLWRFTRATDLAVRSPDPLRRDLGLACAGAMAAMLLVAFVDFNWHIPSTLFLFLTVVGVAWGLDPHPEAGP
ncbi:MAG TPA: O-antigen ligase family protein [Thermoanaerobaculia bacterium]|nr:O-antigen ligase family protein [Thermoanaerobaculia bacterium]